MKRFISSLLVVSMLATAVPAYADDVPIGPPVVAPLDKGRPAPFTGVLLSPPAVAQIVAERDSVAARTAAEVYHQAQIDDANRRFDIDSLTSTCTTDKSILQAQVDEGKRQIVILNDQLKKTTSGPPATLWIGLGAVAGVALTVLTVFAVNQVK